MGHFIRLLFLSLCVISAQAEELSAADTLAPGQLVDIFLCRPPLVAGGSVWQNNVASR